MNCTQSVPSRELCEELARLGICSIPLSNGGKTSVSTEDYAELSKRTWWKDSRGYVMTQYRNGTKKVSVSIHRLITKAPNGMEVDHIDGDKLNNSRANLRIATPSQNQRNKRKTISKTTSKYKGVSWRSSDNSWVAACVYTKNSREYKKCVTGIKDEVIAGMIYDLMAMDVYGEFAKPNFDAIAKALLKIKESI